MSLLSRVANFILHPSSFILPKAKADSSTSTVGISTSGYDAANSSPSRTSFFAFPMNARREITAHNRREILRKVRALEANLGLVRRMKGQVGKYSVGFGVFPTPQTKDTPWNEEARTKFMDWANNPGVCDVAGAMTFWERQKYHAETLFAENESFDALVSSSVSGAPQLQLFDNFEIGHLYGNYTDPKTGITYIDGVQVNAQGRPLSYLVSPDLSSNTPPQSIDAADMIHLVRRKRAGQLRGISPFAPGINSAIDQLDLKSLITTAAKLHEALGLVVKKQSGEAGKQGLTAQVNKVLDGDGNVTRVDEKFLAGGAIQYLKIDEELQIVESKRPTQELVAWYRELVRDVCLSTELTFEIVFSLMELGGAPARIVLSDAQWFFDSLQDIINDRYNQRIWVWWTASMMKSGQLSKCSDPRWWNCRWQGPAKLTADEGYTASAQIDRLYSGQDNWADQYSRHGRYWKPALTQRIEEIAWLNAECAKRNVDPALIFAPRPGTAVPGERMKVEG